MPNPRTQQARSFTELAAAWLYTHRSWNTRAAYEADLSGFATWCAMTGRSPLRVHSDDVADYRGQCQGSGASPATVNRRLSALTSFYRFVAGTEGPAENPAESVTREPASVASATVALDAGEAEAILEAAQRSGPRSASLVGLLLVDGCKVGEVLAADVDDLSRRPWALTVTRRGHAECVTLDGWTGRALRRYLAARTQGPLFVGETPSREPARLSRFGADHILKRVAEDAGVTKPVSANTLRRSYVVRAHARGDSIDDIRAAVGHYDRRTTRRLLPQDPIKKTTTRTRR
jgi:integrase/recombinase XerD